MIVTTPESDDSAHSDDQYYDHHDVDMNTAGCSNQGNKTKKKLRERNKDHPEYHPSQEQRFVVTFKKDKIVHDSVTRKS
ncbi:hypothetical protein ZOSMA_12G00630 [Zostera marina]|uniref:Uncharacterized protein n=1 Tax=Zostera marina TaxID=29655 RepID=A0A0K9PZ86_ZOSMR|nr:hypothetical protein ZOSMA_12G00630 [Zostera marina]